MARTGGRKMKVGLVISLSEARGGGRGSADDYRTIRDRALAAEASGFDSIWLYDHMLFRPSSYPGTVGIWEGWTTMSALAEATNSVEIGSLVSCSQFRNPALLAKMAHTLDEISGGRLILGIGAGWQRAEFDAFGFPFDRRVSRLEEALQIIGPLLRAGEVSFEGQFYTARDCVIEPRSPRKAGPPLMVGAFGPRTMRLAARYADIWNTAYWSSPEEAAEQFRLWDDAVSDVQPEPAPEQSLVARVVVEELLDGDPNPFTSSISGDREAIAKQIQAFAAAGISHLQLHLEPNTVEAFNHLVGAVSLWRTHGHNT